MSPKHCWGVQVGVFMLLFDEYETNQAQKDLS